MGLQGGDGGAEDSDLEELRQICGVLDEDLVRFL